jgi:hypothetical protein
MLTQDAIRHKAGFDLSTSLFVFSFFAMCLCEAYLIQAIWISHTPIHGRVRGAELPFLIWVPAMAGLMLRLVIRMRSHRGEIRPSLASFLNTWLGGVLLVAYLLMARLAEIMFS